MTEKKKAEEPIIFKRFGVLNVSKIGSLNVHQDLILQYLDVRPGELVSYHLNKDRKSLILRKFQVNEPIVADGNAEMQKFLKEQDVYTFKEWEKKKKGPK